LAEVIRKHNYNYSEINYTFCSDAELVAINRKYLQHDYYTDIITFDNTIHDMISADIMISVDRVKDNASQHGLDNRKELMRVMIHGILHCMGFKDNNEDSKSIMRKKEDEALEMFHVEPNRIKDNV
jgi:rRNA maturation RNase YbeY